MGAATFAETEGWEEKDVASIAKRLAALPKNGSKPRMVVITQGADPTIVCVGGEVTEYPIIALPKEKLVDTNGAGDAYVGGFLSGLVQEKNMACCCAAFGLPFPAQAEVLLHTTRSKAIAKAQVHQG